MKKAIASNFFRVSGILGGVALFTAYGALIVVTTVHTFVSGLFSLRIALGWEPDLAKLWEVSATSPVAFIALTAALVLLLKKKESVDDFARDLTRLK